MFKMFYTILTHASLLTHFNIDRHCLLKTDAFNIVITTVFFFLAWFRQQITAYYILLKVNSLSKNKLSDL
jgi:hypothetical protein